MTNIIKIGVLYILSLQLVVQAFVKLPSSISSSTHTYRSNRICSIALWSTKVKAPTKDTAFTTELPDSFEESIQWMADDTITALETGAKFVRIDFDTSVGDQTYTTLKQSLPMVREFVKSIASRIPEGRGGRIKLFFPDAGTAAMMERDWKLGSEESLVPDNLAFTGMHRESMREEDCGCILLCPKNSEADDALRIMDENLESSGDKFVILLNPELVNMGTTGYGLAGRRIRDFVLENFVSAYYLRTLPWGAVTKRLGQAYSIWQEDESQPDGYRLLRNVNEKPTMEDLGEIYEIENGLTTPVDTPAFLNSFNDFVRDFGRL